MPKPDQNANNTSFASRRAEREAREAVEGKPERPQLAFRAGIDAEQPVITVVAR